MNEDDSHNESLEAKLREMAQQIGRTVERAMEDVDLEDVAERIGIESERFKEFTQFAGQWLGAQFGAGSNPMSADFPDTSAPDAAPARRRSGPHPLDTPTEEQGLALSGLSSGRWTVQSGANVIDDEGSGPAPIDPLGVVGELRARDWITADGRLTVIGEDALKRWLSTD